MPNAITEGIDRYIEIKQSEKREEALKLMNHKVSKIILILLLIFLLLGFAGQSIIVGWIINVLAVVIGCFICLSVKNLINIYKERNSRSKK